MKQYLTPTIEDLRLDYVLIQAWKKTAAYLRSFAWYVDTLELDYESLRLPDFISEIQERLNEPYNWESKPIMLVPAPKNQRWVYSDGEWKPRRGEKINEKMRPLAYVNIQDQVVATAIMLCLADRVETAMGDPRIPIRNADNRKKVLAYGHRLFCDKGERNQLHHRWGNSKIYRQYYQDYRAFLERPKTVAESLNMNGKSGQYDDQQYEIAIVQSDISKFYDNVKPEFLWGRLCKFKSNSDENEFFDLAKRVFNWRWDKSNQKRMNTLSGIQGIATADSVALPQGLVAAGFFANIALSDFDTMLKKHIGRELLGTSIYLEDACYYVDDIRLVLRIPKGLSEDIVKTKVVDWIQGLLNDYADGLPISIEKTEVTVEGRDKRFLIKQSSEADRIQHQVSGVFDMQHGIEIIVAIEGFLKNQQKNSADSNKDGRVESGLLVGIPDMEDETAARFAAGKFRRTFRSLRPLLVDDELYMDGFPKQLVITKQQLDERARLFAALLIEEWIKNPGNVRLLRIALDFYPDKEFLESVLTVLREAWSKPANRGVAKREVRLYCLTELFRAGATETGMVEEDECLPGNLSIAEYHEVLIDEATRIVDEYIETNYNRARFPCYLMQQVLFYLRLLHIS